MDNVPKINEYYHLPTEKALNVQLNFKAFVLLHLILFIIHYPLEKYGI